MTPMPGRNPQEAVAEFLEPLREALRVLDGAANISVSPKGGYRKRVRYAWVLNGASGLPLPPAGTFFAQMEFEVIDTDPEIDELGLPLRVTTKSYHYKLRDDDAGQDHWRAHWHPSGNSPVTWPHLHLPSDFKRHLPSERFTLENAIFWCAQYDAPLTCSMAEAEDRLVLAEAPHRLHRSWPPQPRQPSPLE